MNPFARRWWVRALRIPSTQGLLDAFGHALAACGLSFGVGQENVHRVCIPTCDTIASNCGEVRRLLQALGMRERDIPEVSWKSGYSFSRVWVVAEDRAYHANS